MAQATLTINSKNYGAWSLRGWLLCKMSGLDFEEHVLTNDDPDTRAELLLLSSSFLVPAPRARRRHGVGHDGDRRVPARGAARRRAVAVRHRGARALPRGVRRDALGLRQPAIRAPDEPQGAPPALQGVGGRAGRHRPHRHGVVAVPRRLRRAVPVRGQTDDRRRDVRAGVHAVPHLRRRARRDLRTRTATRSWRCRRWSSGSRPRSSNPTSSRSSTSSSRESRSGQPRTASAKARISRGMSPAGVYMISVLPAASAATATRVDLVGGPDPAGRRQRVAGGGEDLAVARHHVGDVALVHREVALTLGPLGLDAGEPLLAAGHGGHRLGERLPHAVVADDVPGAERVLRPARP